jgi:hypothetical protein
MFWRLADGWFRRHNKIRYKSNTVHLKCASSAGTLAVLINGPALGSARTQTSCRQMNFFDLRSLQETSIFEFIRVPYGLNHLPEVRFHFFTGKRGKCASG